MKVIVLGTLGDLVKKIVEIEIKAMDSEDSVRKEAVRIQTYYKVLEKWPVSDFNNLMRYQLSFKMGATKLFMLDGLFEQLAHPEISSERLKEYFDAKKNLKKLIGEINKLSLSTHDPFEIEVDE